MYPTFKYMILAHPLPLFLFWIPGALFLANRLNQNWDYIEPQAQLAGVLGLVLWGIPTLLALPKVWWHLYQKRKHTSAGLDPEVALTRRRRRQGVTLALLAVGTFEYVLSWLSQHSFEQDGHHYLTALVLLVGLSLLPFILFYRSSRSWSSYLFLALVSVAGGAGIWQLAEHPELMSSPELSVYLPLTAAICTLLPPLLIVVALLLRGLVRLRGISFPNMTHSEKKAFTVKWCLPVPKQSRSAAGVMVPDYCRQILASKTKAAA